MPKLAGEITFPRLKCTYCGSPVDLRDYKLSSLQSLMIERKLCFTCAYWMSKADDMPEHCHVIDGQLIAFNPWKSLGEREILPARGYKPFYIMLNDGDVKRSNNISVQGAVPQYLRHLFPDTARYINKDIYYKVKRHPFFKCQSKGCWDRYHCYWYDMELEKNGPWNEIPKSHKMGDECCESFLDKTTIP